MPETPFSFHELQTANPIEVPTPATITASDGTKLAYRRYAPVAPQAAVLFYHGGGAHSGVGYPYLGHGLQSQCDTVVYMPDVRGHGASGGPRGDTPHPQQVWSDITTFINFIRAEFPGLPLFLGGHSSGAGLLLNYVSQPDHAPADQYIFLAPELGFRSKTAQPSITTPFATVNTAAFIMNALSGGWLRGHSYAVRFTYPAALLAADPGMVASYTVNMANAVTPAAPHKQFANLDRPFGLWIGAEDELLVPSLVLAFADLATAVRPTSAVGSIAGAKHLSILLAAHETVGAWIRQVVHAKPD